MDKFHLLLHRICKLFGASVYYQSKYGIKVLNRPPISPVSQGQAELKAAELYLACDWLKDEKTLCGQCILTSPHLDLMRTLHEGGDFDSCSYVVRRREGSLDGMHPETMERTASERKFAEMKERILSGNYAPAKVYALGGRYYILDGKHRAALCGLLDQPIRCEVIDVASLSGSKCYRRYCKKMSGKPQYARNIAHLEQMLKSDQTEDSPNA